MKTYTAQEGIVLLILVCNGVRFLLVVIRRLGPQHSLFPPELRHLHHLRQRLDDRLGLLNVRGREQTVDALGQTVQNLNQLVKMQLPHQSLQHTCAYTCSHGGVYI